MFCKRWGHSQCSWRISGFFTLKVYSQEVWIRVSQSKSFYCVSCVYVNCIQSARAHVTNCTLSTIELCYWLNITWPCLDISYWLLIPMPFNWLMDSLCCVCLIDFAVFIFADDTYYPLLTVELSHWLYTTWSCVDVLHADNQLVIESIVFYLIGGLYNGFCI